MPARCVPKTPRRANGVTTEATRGYAPNAVGLIEAVDAGTGKTVWLQEPTEKTLQAVAGQSTRGVDDWENGGEQRLPFVRGMNLYTLDAKTSRGRDRAGAPRDAFGNKFRAFDNPTG